MMVDSRSPTRTGTTELQLSNASGPIVVDKGKSSHTSMNERGNLPPPISIMKRNQKQSKDGQTVCKLSSKETYTGKRVRFKAISSDHPLRQLSEHRPLARHDSRAAIRRQSSRQLQTAQDAIGRTRSWVEGAPKGSGSYNYERNVRAALQRSLSNVDADLEDNEESSSEDDEELEEVGDDLSVVPESGCSTWSSLSEDTCVNKDKIPAHKRTKSIASPMQSTETNIIEPEDCQLSLDKTKSSPPMHSQSKSVSSFGSSLLGAVSNVANFVQSTAKNIETQVESVYSEVQGAYDEAVLISDGYHPSLYIPPQSVAASMNVLSTDSSPLEASESPPVIPEISASLEERSLHASSSLPALVKSGLPVTNSMHLARNNSLPTPPHSSLGQVKVDAILMRHLHLIQGLLIVDEESISFRPEKLLDESGRTIAEPNAPHLTPDVYHLFFKVKEWKLNDVESVYRRRYLLQSKALEIFIRSARRGFLFTMAKEDVTTVYNAIVSHEPQFIHRHPILRRLRSPGSLFRNSNMTRRWVNYEMSTFDYLMWLNRTAGRTYNDLGQYPVFPWVLADYESSTLDLTRVSTFRDLSKPVGALNASRLESFTERYKHFDDPDIPKFLYGSHYSHAGAVLFYLLRLEPFTSYAMAMQDGKFDHADRMFHSIPETWYNCLHDLSDLKELTPEWFYLPEFLLNTNSLALGTRQDGEKLGDVVLPPWAASAEDFVLKNAAALESEYVSMNLHKWIDLVFGCKQRGKAAADAQNLFFYLTYEGTIDLDAVEDPVLTASLKSQIAHFGQAPSQLLRSPHPTRLSYTSMSPRIDKWIPHDHPLCLLQAFAETSTLLCVDKSGVSSRHRFGSTRSPFDICEKDCAQPDSLQIKVSSENTKWLPQAVVNASSELECQQIAFIDNGAILVAIEKRVNAVTFSSTSDGSVRLQLPFGAFAVTCLSVDKLGSMLALGHDNGSICIWKKGDKTHLLDAVYESKGTLYAHQFLAGSGDSVNCIALSNELELCVAGFQTNACVAYDLQDASILHRFCLEGTLEPGVLHVAMSSVGHVTIQSVGSGSPKLYSFHINGQLLAETDLGIERMTSLDVSGKFAKVIVINSRSAMTLSADTLALESTLLIDEEDGQVYCQSLMPTETHVLFGVGVGRLVSLPLFQID